MKTALFFSTMFLFASSLLAQHAQIKGTINDTINHQKTEHASVLLLHKKDSVLYQFTRSNENGNFTFNKADTGKYILLISESTYADYVDTLVVRDSSNINLGNISLTLKANILKEVVVRQQIAAMRMKGDTTEYVADSFKVAPGASVEDMLKKLPGVQVDKDGKITAQGEKVQKVLVDGEEFFGDDPTLATRNIQADAIDKIQMYDKKSDQATFTGIDDGQKNKTINLTLKADKKKGYFGKIDLASDFKNRWNNSAMVNNFKGKTKVSAYGIVSNTGKTGLDWNEQDKYGSGNNMEYNEDFGGFMMWSESDDFSSGSFNGQGVPKSWSGGINGSQKWDDEKQHANGSYKYTKLDVDGTSQTISQSLLPGDASFITRENSSFYSSRDRHSLNGLYEFQIDSSTSTKITATGYTGTSKSYNGYNSSNTNGSGVQVNNSNRFTTSDGNNQNLNVNAIFRKKFKKTGRSFSFNVNEIINNNASTGFLKAAINYYDSKTGDFLRDSITNQMKENNSKVNTLSAKAVYTEPLTKKLYLEMNYAIRSNISTSERLSFDSTNNGKYESLNPLYSNQYRFDVLTNTGGLAFRYNSKKVTASVGSDAGFTNFYQKDLLVDTAYTRRYVNFYPRANFTLKLEGNVRINLNYNGNTRQPSITQIQPLRDNTNPLFVYLGNSALKQSFSHQINLSFNKYNVFKERGISLWSSFNTTSHDIVTSQFTDTSTGKTTLQYINASGNYNYDAAVDLNGKLKKLNMYANINFGINGSQYSNIVNDVKNTTSNNAPSFGIGLSKNKEKKFDMWFNSRFNYNFSKSTIQQNFTTNYWTMEHQLNLNVSLPWHLVINTDFDYNIRQKTNVFTTNNNVFLWNAYFGRRLLKNEKAIIKITANDILNENKGFTRNINSNTLTQQSYTTLRRYFMLAFTWNFSKTPGGATTSNQ